jgi:hypothetical protein
MAYTPKVGDYYSGPGAGGGGASGYYRYNGTNWEWKGRSKPSSGRQVTKEQARGTEKSEKPEDGSGDGNGSPTKSLRYPEGLDYGKETDYLLFTFHRYKDNTGSLSENGTSPETDETLFKKADGLPDQIILNMPQEVQSEFGAEWGGKAFSFIGRQFASAGGALTTGDFGAAAGALGNLITNTITTGEAAQAAAAAAVVAGINKIPGVGGNLTMNDLIQGASSKILNPNVELMYEGPQLRSLSLNLKLVAKTSGEADMLRKIGRAFRKATLPSTDSDRFIKTPSYVKVRFMRGSNDNPDLPKYRMCAITGASVNYAPDGQYVSFAGGYLPALQIGLTLQETKIIFSNDITIEADGAQY